MLLLAKCVRRGTGEDSGALPISAGLPCGDAGHVHLLISGPADVTPSVVLKVLKQRVSRDLRKRKLRAQAGQLRLCFMKGSESLPRFWQARFYDFNLYSAKKKREKLEYMHANPVMRKLVEHPKDWPCSSFSYYAKGEPGLVPIDLAD